MAGLPRLLRIFSEGPRSRLLAFAPGNHLVRAVGCAFPAPAAGGRGVRPAMGSVRDAYGDAMRELLRHAGVRTHQADPFADPGRDPPGGISLHQGLVQPAPAAFGPRLRVASQLRGAGARRGGMTPAPRSSPTARCAFSAGPLLSPGGWTKGRKPPLNRPPKRGKPTGPDAAEASAERRGAAAR